VAAREPEYKAMAELVGPSPTSWLRSISWRFAIGYTKVARWTSAKIRDRLWKSYGHCITIMYTGKNFPAWQQAVSRTEGASRDMNNLMCGSDSRKYDTVMKLDIRLFTAGGGPRPTAEARKGSIAPFFGYLALSDLGIWMSFDILLTTTLNQDDEEGHNNSQTRSNIDLE
jgi:hypothetical protein